MQDISSVLLAINIGTLAAIVFSLRRQFAMEKKLLKFFEQKGFS